MNQRNIPLVLLLSLMMLCFFFMNSRQHPAEAHGTEKKEAPSRTLFMSPPIHNLDIASWEPMIVEHPDGSLFVSGFKKPSENGQTEDEPALIKSRDGGNTWIPVNVGTKSDGAVGSSDTDLAVSRDGTLYYVTMIYDEKEGEGKQISIAVSKDAGATWKWTLLSKARFSDRPWVEVAPDGTAHVIWNDGSGVCHAVSKDGGITWKELERIHSKGGSSHLAIGPNGEVAVRVTPLSASGFKYDAGIDLVAVSTDGGKTWQKHTAPGTREWNLEGYPIWRWVEPLAWDTKGALYSFWTNLKGLWLARSIDRGATWTTWHLRESPELEYFPYLVAQGSGQLAVTWFSGWAETLHAHVARIDIGEDDTHPRMAESSPFSPDSWRKPKAWPDNPGIRITAGEYLAVSFLRKGSLVVVSTIMNKREKRFGFTLWKVE